MTIDATLLQHLLRPLFGLRRLVKNGILSCNSRFKSETVMAKKERMAIPRNKGAVLVDAGIMYKSARVHNVHGV